MARSVHDTRGVLLKTLRDNYADPEEKRQRIQDLQENLSQQRAFKQQERDRRQRRGLSLPPFDPDLVPVVVSDEGPYVHHSATEEDVRAVLRRLPPGMLDGLTAVHLRLHREWPEGPEEKRELDPYLGTAAGELLPGVYEGDLRGLCEEGGGQVHVFAHIHEPGAAGVHAIYLKLRALHTLVHECAHHFDDSFRGDGERWHKRDENRNEKHARAQAAEQLTAYVVPYLEERYPSECQALKAWLERVAGVELPLDWLEDDRNGRSWGGHIYRDLAWGLAEGIDVADIRDSIAEYLSLARRHDDAARVLELVHRELPDDIDAMLDLARELLWLGRPDEAEPLCRRVIELDPQQHMAWERLAHVCCQRGQWTEMAACIDRSLPIRVKIEYPLVPALEYRGEAWLGLERWDNLAADIEALEAIDTPRAQRCADVLRLRMTHKKEKWAEAFERAGAMLHKSGRFVGDAFVRAIRFECAIRTGRRKLAGKLTDRDVADLRYHGEGAWVDRLVADFGLPKSL